MADYLPMFPLKLVFFPGELRGLYIFEERYKELINECRDTGMTFGIPIISGNQMASIGTEVKLLSIDEVKAGGEMHIRIEGTRRFRVVTFKAKDRYIKHTSSMMAQVCLFWIKRKRFLTTIPWFSASAVHP